MRRGAREIMAIDTVVETSEESEAPSLETSNYEVIRRRLVEQGQVLARKADALNAKRQEVFSAVNMEVVGNQTITTENNCTPQDIINLGDRLLFGYNVQRKMSDTRIEDVFSLHAFGKQGDDLQLRHLPQDTAENFLSDPAFIKDFEDLYFSFHNAFLRQLRRVGERLFAIFQTGAKLDDVRVLQWAIDVDDRVSFIDNLGEKHNTRRPTHDFEWIPTKREDMITGRHPHISIRDKIFVETVGGDLTIKVEDNTESGEGIYAEPVEEKNQALGDAKIFFAEVNNLILLKIKPYREEEWRYFVVNTLTKSASRIDTIGLSCVTLPEDHGIIFPGGYVLESGEVKTFNVAAEDLEEMLIEEVRRSSNGEDVLYAFYRPRDGQYLLLSYNLIRKEVLNPILCHGYSIFDDGTMIIFRSTRDQQTRHHPMQIWQTPFVSDAYAAEMPTDGSFMSKVGNAALVRGISDALSIRKVITNQSPTTELYESIIRSAETMIDQHYWLSDGEVDDLSSTLRGIISTAQLVIEEFEKVRQMKRRAAEALEEAAKNQSDLFGQVRYAETFKTIEKFVEGLDGLRLQRGRLITLREMKYIDTQRIDDSGRRGHRAGRGALQANRAVPSE